MRTALALPPRKARSLTKRLLIGLAIIAVAAAALLALPLIEGYIMPFDQASIAALVDRLGVFGPLALIGLMVLAIVVSPIPSGPIAVAAGAIYGTVWGAAFVIIGAFLGAIAAFGAARYLGFDAIRRSENAVLKYIAAPRSETALMVIVFASRLVPFISFDAISYAAGLTCLSFWRFAIATLLGVVPICFALAAVGADMMTSGTDWMLIISLLGAVTLLPVVARWLWLKRAP